MRRMLVFPKSEFPFLFLNPTSFCMAISQRKPWQGESWQFFLLFFQLSISYEPSFWIQRYLLLDAPRAFPGKFLIKWFRSSDLKFYIILQFERNSMLWLINPFNWPVTFFFFSCDFFSSLLGSFEIIISHEPQGRIFILLGQIERPFSRLVICSLLDMQSVSTSMIQNKMGIIKKSIYLCKFLFP